MSDRKKQWGAEIFRRGKDATDAEAVKLDATLSESAQEFLAEVYNLTKEMGKPIEGGLVLLVQPGGGVVLAGRGIDGRDSVQLLEAVLANLRAARAAAPPKGPVS